MALCIGSFVYWHLIICNCRCCPKSHKVSFVLRIRVKATVKVDHWIGFNPKAIGFPVHWRWAIFKIIDLTDLEAYLTQVIYELTPTWGIQDGGRTGQKHLEFYYEIHVFQRCRRLFCCKLLPFAFFSKQLLITELLKAEWSGWTVFICKYLSSNVPWNLVTSRVTWSISRSIRVI